MLENYRSSFFEKRKLQLKNRQSKTNQEVEILKNKTEERNEERGKTRNAQEELIEEIKSEVNLRKLSIDGILILKGI